MDSSHHKTVPWYSLIILTAIAIAAYLLGIYSVASKPGAHFTDGFSDALSINPPWWVVVSIIGIPLLGCIATFVALRGRAIALRIVGAVIGLLLVALIVLFGSQALQAHVSGFHGV